ncbi:hypothetical protein DPMN_173677 [Dreissena polymorpha]|uniref:Uncharacterized protein n=1 Tax=Dreissena polymorpha TaxID=45954 RepID=A0A9D4IFR0_DREPO|nr:hypothetical protein DPMN_173677 [Dreissena polymorpha]
MMLAITLIMKTMMVMLITMTTGFIMRIQYDQSRSKMCLVEYAAKVAPDQCAHPRGLIRTKVAPGQCAHPRGLIRTKVAPGQCAHPRGLIRTKVAPGQCAHPRGLIRSCPVRQKITQGDQPLSRLRDCAG